MVDVIEAIADAIMHYEGWGPITRSYRNRNPGNLRAEWDYQEQDADHYEIFPSFPIGYRVLVADLHSKVTGNNSHGLTVDSTLEDLFRVYAPSADGNAPKVYAAFVARWLNQVYDLKTILGGTTLRTVYEVAGQEVPSGQRTS